MSNGQRPGGLTALAVFNFILGALGFVGGLALVTFVRYADVVIESAASEQERMAMEAFQNLGTGPFALIVGVNLATSVLLVVSGIGYLKLRAFLGRTLGNVYAVTAIAGSLLTGLVLPVELGGGFSLGSVLNLVYPLLTLFMLNVVFKEDFVR
jgi:hypothetical protein